jgi:dienelactone hydrolase
MANETDSAGTDTGAPMAWTPETMMKVRGVEGARVSPDGARAAFVVTDAVMTDEKSEFVAQIWLGNIDGSDSYPATFGETSSRNPQWSPDGKWLAFTAKRGEKVNLLRLRLSGGEAEPLLTNLKSDVGEFRWSPDGQQIAFLMTDPKTEDEEKNEKSKNDWRYENEDLKYSRLYVVPVEKDANGKREFRKLTAEDYNVGALAEGPFDWSPDGKRIAFVHMEGITADSWPSSKISIVTVDSGEVRPLVAEPAAAAQPVFSPDGQTIAFVLSYNPPTWASAWQIHLIPASGGEIHSLPNTHNEGPTLTGWSADGKHIFFAEMRGTGTALSSMDVASGKIDMIYAADGVSWGFHLNTTKTHFGFHRQTSDTPVEAFAAPVTDFVPVRISAINQNLPDFPLGKTEIIRWNAPDGQEIEGLLTYPVGYEPGQKVPLILNVHGGPAGVFLDTFTAMPGIYSAALFAAQGIAVLRPNPRGSTGYGSKFRHANLKDWGGDDYLDLMAGVVFAVTKGIADKDRLGVMGWSYGGFMTSWIITHTQRFKAASIGAPVTNLVSFNGTADIPSFLPSYFGAEFWDDPDIYATHSPISFVKDVSTPALIQHCEGDIRVPISQGLEFYNALRRQNVPVRMLRIPRQTHGPTEPRMYVKIMASNLEWFQKYL